MAALGLVIGTDGNASMNEYLFTSSTVCYPPPISKPEASVLPVKCYCCMYISSEVAGLKLETRH